MKALSMKALIAKILDRLTTEIVTETYDLGAITYTAGTIGSTATTISVSIGKTGYTPIGLAVSYVNSNVVGFRPFMRGSTGYVQIIRGQSGAFSSTYSAYLIVTYKKS